MTILDRYLGARMLAALFKTMLSLVLLFILIDLLTHRRADVVRFDVPWNVVAAYYLVYIPQILYKFQVAALAVRGAEQILRKEVNAGVHSELLTRLKTEL